MELNLEELPGIYFIQIESDGKRLVKKVVVN
jgi:hypothetical protein